MDLMTLLRNSGGESSIEQLAGTLGLGSSQTRDLVGSLSPALVKILQQQAAMPGGLDGLKRALDSGKHEQYMDRPELMQSEATRQDGNKILGHLFGSKDVSRQVAAQASGQTGVDASTIRKALPFVASLAMGALSKKFESGGDHGNSLAGLLGGLMDGDTSEGFGMDDVMGMARKLF